MISIHQPSSYTFMENKFPWLFHDLFITKSQTCLCTLLWGSKFSHKISMVHAFKGGYRALSNFHDCCHFLQYSMNFPGHGHHAPVTYPYVCRVPNIKCRRGHTHIINVKSLNELSHLWKNWNEDWVETFRPVWTI